MSNNLSKKMLEAVDISPTVLDLDTTYTWFSDRFACGGLDELKLLLTFADSINATSVELKSQIEDWIGADYFTEFKTVLGTVTLAEVTLAGADLAAESNRISLSFDCKSFQQVRFAVKRTGGTQGTCQMEVLGA